MVANITYEAIFDCKITHNYLSLLFSIRGQHYINLLVPPEMTLCGWWDDNVKELTFCRNTVTAVLKIKNKNTTYIGDVFGFNVPGQATNGRHSKVLEWVLEKENYSEDGALGGGCGGGGCCCC